MPAYFPNLVQMGALGGIIPISQMPTEADAKGNSEWILVRFENGSQYKRPSPYTVDFTTGRILVSVKKPSNLALVKLPLGQASINANGDVLFTYTDGVLRIDNLTGTGQSVKVRLAEGPFAKDPKQVSIAPGYEVIAGDHKLTVRDLHPHDGIARRKFRMLQDGSMAVNEFSVESALRNVSMIVELSQQSNGVKERRILGDVSKMAAVLNYVNGSEGYTEEK
jgi:hypothetical protein